MKILVLNWKDHHHPQAGGAEDFTYKIMRGLAESGHEIVWFSSLYPGASRTSHEEGIDFVRAGAYRTVHGKSKAYIRAITSKNKPDVIIDEVNTRPFNPSRWLEVDVPVVNLIHQLAREVWFQETPFPLAFVGRYLLEDHWLRAIRRHLTITVSPSTEDDLRALGFSRTRIVYNPLSEIPEWAPGMKANPPDIVYLGRLSRGKRPKDCFEAFRIIRQKHHCSMTVIGTGPLLPEMKKAYPEIVFVGYISEKAKKTILKRAGIILATGTREGWNRGVLEAQSYGVVPVVQDIPGLRDAVGGGIAGIKVTPGSAEDLAKAASTLIEDREYLASLSRACYEWANEFTYSKSKAKFESVLFEAVGDKLH